MKRVLVLIFAGLIAALAVLYAVRVAESPKRISAAELLPGDTIAIAHLPDFSRTRKQWHELDIYQLLHEPAVQDFLRKPFANLSPTDSKTIGELIQLDPKQAFVALTKIENNNPALVGGFRYRGDSASAEKTIERWRTTLLTNNQVARRETIQYAQHQIDTIAVGPFTLATAFVRDWFFVANDIEELKAAIQRAARPGQDRQSTLATNEDFLAAMAHMPPNYAAAVYLQPKIFVEKLASLRAGDGRSVSPEQRTMLEQMRALCGATRFEHGKIHDVFFVRMAKLQDEKLKRPALALGTKETFFYLATVLNVAQKFDALNQAAGTAPATAVWARAIQAFARSGVSAEDWKAAFGVEGSALADWPAEARWPSCFVMFSVQDQVRAARVVEALVKMDEDSSWNRIDKNGVRYFSMLSPASLVAITPTIALSNHVMIVGLDPGSVEEAVERSESGKSELAHSANYESVAHVLPEPTDLFAYVDLPLLYSRLDATLRPMFMVSAAFFPKVAKQVDPSRLPPVDVVTKHLSPIVSSHRYDRDGYVAESIGSITLNHAGAGVVALTISASNAFQHAVPTGLNSPVAPTSRGKSKSPSPTPAGTP